MAPNACSPDMAFPASSSSPCTELVAGRNHSLHASSSSRLRNPTVPPPVASPMEKINIQTIAKGGVATPFPYKLHILLDQMDAEAAKGDLRGKAIVGWQPHGRAFKVHLVKEFVRGIMPHFFKQTKYASFQRQLNLYGFTRLTIGPDKGAVYHPCFVRNQPQLIQGMVRKRIKGTKIRKAVLPESQPNFYANEQLRAIAAVDAAFDASVAASSSSSSASSNRPLNTPIAPRSRSSSSGTAPQAQSPALAPQPLPPQALQETTAATKKDFKSSSVSPPSFPVLPQEPPVILPLHHKRYGVHHYEVSQLEYHHHHPNGFPSGAVH